MFSISFLKRLKPDPSRRVRRLDILPPGTEVEFSIHIDSVSAKESGRILDARLVIDGNETRLMYFVLRDEEYVERSMYIYPDEILSITHCPQPGRRLTLVEETDPDVLIS